MGIETDIESLEIEAFGVEVVDGALSLNGRQVESIVDQRDHVATIADPGSRLELARRAFAAGVRACGGHFITRSASGPGGSSPPGIPPRL